MGFLPDWVPSLHPLVVHFPIALLVSAVVIDLVSLFARSREGILRAANLLYLGGTLALVATYFAGRAAADLVFLGADAQPLLTEHAWLGQISLFFFAGYTLVRVPLSVTAVGKGAPVRVILFVLGLGGAGLMTWTAHHGAELVFRYGAGVQAVEDRPADLPVMAADTTAVGSGVARAADGTIFFSPRRAAAWQNDVSWIEGSAGAVRSSLVDGADRGDVLAFDLDQSTVFFELPDTLASMQVDLEIDLTAFDGTFMITHETVDGGNFRFASFGANAARLGRAENGDLLVSESAGFEAQGWHALRFVVDAGHARTYVDTEMAVHGHFPAAPVGRVGFRLNGTGRVRVAYVTVTPIGTTAP